jgi:DNA-binding NarL/FixJ family response regulator
LPDGAVLDRPRPSTRPSEPRLPARRSAVLLDPHPLWLDALERVLGRAGVHVVAKTSSPRAALAAVELHDPDLLVTEIETGEEVDGVTWLRRALELMSSGKAIVLSRHDAPELIDAALRAGAVAYVIKTAQTDDLASAVRQVFDHSVYLGAPDGQQASDGDVLAERFDLTARELEILQLLVEGHSNAQLAHMLWVTEQTVKFHLSNIYRKLGVANRSEASRTAQLVRLDA